MYAQKSGIVRISKRANRTKKQANRLLNVQRRRELHQQKQAKSDAASRDILQREIDKLSHGQRS